MDALLESATALELRRERQGGLGPVNDREAAILAGTLSHPLRIGFLTALRERQVLSPIEYARTSGELLGNVSYHVKTLARAEVIVVSERISRRGAVEHRYALTGRRAPVVLALMDLLAAA
jgi:DNA-binding transcriptional ArsR family regulator